MAEQLKVPVAILRGGTSKGVFITPDQLPADPATREKFILALFGSPDRRQIDGLGGADPLTSKLCIVSPSSRPGCDVDYTFAQVGVELPTVSYEINCGNLSPAVAVYAIQEGWVQAREPFTEVRIFNTNTQRILVATVPVRDGHPVVEGDFSVDGVPGTGAEVKLDYRLAAGGATGHLLPTGNAIDEIEVPQLNKRVRVSIVDIGNLTAFVDAGAMGCSGVETPDTLTMETSVAFGHLKDAVAALLDLKPARLLPFTVSIAPPAGYRTFGGTEVSAEDVDVVARAIRGPGVHWVGAYMHKAYPGTVGVATSVASRIPGTIVWEAARAGGGPKAGDVLRIGHPSGVIAVAARVEQANGTVTVEEARFSRTVRRIMDGYAYVRRDRLQ